jgi:hypothetical protein
MPDGSVRKDVTSRDVQGAIARLIGGVVGFMMFVSLVYGGVKFLEWLFGSKK